MGQHKHKKAGGKGFTSEKRIAENGMHRHDGYAPAADTPGHTHTEVATGQQSGPAIDRGSENGAQR